MDVFMIDEHRVIKCVHCDGSGICRHSVYINARRPIYEDSSSSAIFWALSCSKCGTGVFLKGISCGFLLMDSRAPGYLRPPACSVCTGKGYNVI